MKKYQFYILVALIWIAVLLQPIFAFDYLVDTTSHSCASWRTDGKTPFSCSQDYLLANLMSSIFWGIIGTAVLSKVITIDSDEEE